ncbi:peptidase M29 [Candidatus Epulonipiscium fishelsonii]|uniref:Peptidase M29 n=1 Tax=Candidatus Epulonipiscium fishelsonii TaxID=77094 RepID=A0ACC8XFY4_9FIRM|nr:peptidase M29 [Epulopiscium sp. SCG-B11WGA-EpuloA1]ONI43818.1 peptidase M29 [Epulopiscium sp. SCG-B05WGA-EpuloA1]
MDNRVEKYAKLIIEMGVNIQEGQYLMINSPIETAYFARALTRFAYQRGAKKVYVEYHDELLLKLNYDYAPDEAFLEYPQWVAKGMETLGKNNCAFIRISASNPELLKDVDSKKISMANKTARIALAAHRKQVTNGEVAWCIASVPTPEWSQKVFPQLSQEDAIKELWEKIYIANRINEEYPVKAWQKHIDEITKHTTYLNSQKIKSLHYIAPNTDLVIELPKGHKWEGGGGYNLKGTYFIANMPTEEVFTMPHKYSVNGKISSTKPLNYGGKLIDEFTLYFEKGKIVDFEAKLGYNDLKHLIETDKGSAYLGEVAIVPISSAVNKTNVLFYNTLFDENASCHLAIGSCYAENIEGGKNMSDEELEAAGANVSLNHVDFMVGSDELNITATTWDGEIFDVLKNGEWAL